MFCARFTIRGARGTAPALGPEFARYGGNTTCFSLTTPEGMIIVDGGTGLSNVEREGDAAGRCPPVTFLLTHVHLDHIVGLPFFRWLYRRSFACRFLGDPRREGGWRGPLCAFFGKPYWPVDLPNAGAAIAFEDLPVARGALDAHGVRIRWRPVRHPQECLAYRLETSGKAVVIATDREPGEPSEESDFARFCAGADVLVHDAQYTPREYAGHEGWGHSTWQTAAEIARAAGVGELILTHHDRGRTDAQLEAILEEARAAFPSTRLARENLSVEM